MKQRRNASKTLIQVVFLAPFWNGEVSSASKVAEVKDQYSIGESSRHSYSCRLYDLSIGYVPC